MGTGQDDDLGNTDDRLPDTATGSSTEADQPAADSVEARSVPPDPADTRPPVPDSEARPPVPDSGARPATPPDSAPTGDARRRLAIVIALYTALRLGLTAVLAALLAIFMPLLVALAFALVLQMPLAFVLFRGTRQRLSEALAVANAQRRAERERLQAALAGDADGEDDR